MFESTAGQFGSKCSLNGLHPPQRGRVPLALAIAASFLSAASTARASLDGYDALISADAAAGLVPLARLTSSLTFNGSNKAPFDFGTNSGNATFEFILEGNPSPNPGCYLAVGANVSSNLRYELWYDTGEVGFTELGVYDYSFSPGVPSPTQPTHIAYVWDAANRTMELYVNGHLGGTRSDVSERFAMPSGLGWLGANPRGEEAMVGIVYRLTVYDGIVSKEVILSHADAFNDAVQPPKIASFTASPEAVFTPGTATLSWEVQDATGIFINGTDVSGTTSLTVSPAVTSSYTLLATNASAAASAQVTVLVNPAPAIDEFRASRSVTAPGQSVTLTWRARFAQALSISPEPGDVTPLTSAGAGSAELRPVLETTYVLAASNPSGTSTAAATVAIAHPADHLVISEFMADDRSTLPDENGQYSGWIEIHNPTAAPVNLGGYFLTDSAAAPTRWAFPSTNLVGGGYLVVFASGQNRTQAGRSLHTNFRLKDSGEYLALVGPGPVVVHEFAPSFPPQRPDISFGVLEDDLERVQAFGEPTPGARNSETLPPPEPVQFSVPSGTFTAAFSLVLSAPDSRAAIWFTVDGSPPGAGTGVRYLAPVVITNTTTIRAVAIVGTLKSQLRGANYIKLGTDMAGYTSSLPIMVIENFGAGSIPRKGWNQSGAGIKQVPRQTAVWATFERTNGFSTLTDAPQMVSFIGIRGRGAYSTEWRQKPYSVEAIDAEGAEREVSPLGMPKHANWVLYFPDPRPSGDPTLLFNTFAYQLSGRMGHYAVRFRWVEAFINEDGGELTLADRRGVYAIVEKVARGKNRLNFQRLSEDGSSGGWLLNINRMDPEPETGWPASNGATSPWFFHTGGPDGIVQTQPNRAYNPVPGGDLPQQWNAFINFDNPNGYVISTNQRTAIEGWFKRFENVLYDNALWRDPVNGYRRYIDTMEFADYFVLNVLTRNGDGLLLSMFPWKGDDDKLRIGPAWDYNWSSYYVSGGPTGSLMHRADQLWYARLFADPDFLQLYIDRWWDLRRGPMSNSGIDAIIDEQAADIGPEKSLLNGLPSTIEWSRRLAQMKTWLKQRADWVDSNYLRPPVFNQNGGEVPDGFLVEASATNATIYLTTDGTDPRAPGGAIAASARSYAGPWALHAPTLIKARARNGAAWSALTIAFFSTPQEDSDGDGMLNWQEDLAGTDPNDPASCLKLRAETISESAGVTLAFWAMPERTYAIEYSDQLPTTVWIRLGEIPARSFGRLERVSDGWTGASRFYRVVTPASP